MDMPEVTKMMDEMNDSTAAIRADRDRLQAINAELVGVLQECREVLTTLAVGESRVDGGPKRVTHSAAVSLGHKVSAALAKAKETVK